MKETYSYKGWLNSDSFLKRALSIFGYGLIPMLIFYGILVGIGVIWVILSNLIAS
jgi:hypothetical protein